MVLVLESRKNEIDDEEQLDALTLLFMNKNIKQTKLNCPASLWYVRLIFGSNEWNSPILVLFIHQINKNVNDHTTTFRCS